MAKPTTPRTRKTTTKTAPVVPVVQSAAALNATSTEPKGFLATQIDLETQIRQRAFELYKERGCMPGQQDEDWLRAEQEVRAHNGHHNA
ncbi:MAG TPA: DUF2934 domain-containing protein [Terriglobales bacterium]